MLIKCMGGVAPKWLPWKEVELVQMLPTSSTAFVMWYFFVV